MYRRRIESDSREWKCNVSFSNVISTSNVFSNWKKRSIGMMPFEHRNSNKCIRLKAWIPWAAPVPSIRHRTRNEPRFGECECLRSSTLDWAEARRLLSSRSVHISSGCALTNHVHNSIGVWGMRATTFSLQRILKKSKGTQTKLHYQPAVPRTRPTSTKSFWRALSDDWLPTNSLSSRVGALQSDLRESSTQVSEL